MRRVLDLFTEQGTVDEMGLGSLTQLIADDLFPGTSVIQTRLRYVLFVPWLYQSLERKRVTSADVGKAARSAEIGLIESLVRSEDTAGVIGARARGGLTRLPSEVYWPALVHWQFFQHAQNKSWYQRHFSSLVRGGAEMGRADDPGIVWARKPNWHPRLPKPPESFPGEANFALTYDEADFVRGRITERCPGTLLGWLAQEGSSSPAAAFWEDPDVARVPSALAATVELARRFSLHVEGAPLLYNLLLAVRRHAEHGDDEELIESYQAQMAQWAAKEEKEAPFDSGALWAYVARRGGRTPAPQIRFVEAWSRRIGEVGPARAVDDAALRALVEQREIQLKGNRARLANAARLLEWSGSVGVGRNGFRWHRVRQILTDLHRGLES